MNKLYKNLFIAGILLLPVIGKSQTIDSIYVNLYTDSLKKGTYNYINVDGLLSNGSYLPLDSTHLVFKSSCGKFYGNSLWIDPAMHSGKVEIEVTMRSKPSMKQKFSMYIKTVDTNPSLKTEKEVLEEMKQQRQQQKKDGYNKT